MKPRRLGVLTGLTGLLGVLVLTAGGLPAAAQLDPPYCGPSLDSRNQLDLNGDGYDDAAVGDPYATVAGQREAGTVTILFGDSRGIGSGARQVLTEATLGGSPEAGDHFGADVDLARADTGESCANLLIGTPGEDLFNKADAGLVYFVGYLSDDIGEPPVRYSYLIDEESAGGTIEAGDAFGSVVKIYPTPEDEERRFVISAPGEDLGGVVDAGAVSVCDGTGGLLIYQGKLLPGGKVRVPGTPQAGDRFGAAVAIGSLDLGAGPGFGLVVGAPGDVVAGRDNAGSVTALVKGDDYFDRSRLITQATTGVPGSAEAGDLFGYSVAMTRQIGLASKLAVGAPGEDDGKITDTGSVTLFTNQSGGFAVRTSFSQNTAGFPDSNEAGDRFGHALAFGSASSMLWVGAPTENLGGAADAGLVQPVRVSGTGPVTPEAAFSETSFGGSYAVGNRFGNVLASLDGLTERLLTASSVYAGQGKVWVQARAGTSAPTFRSWTPSAGAERFGWSVTN